MTVGLGKRVITLALLLLLVVGCTGGVARPEQSSVTGEVWFVDSDGHRVLGPNDELTEAAWVTVHVNNTDLVTYTNALGQFELNNVPSGEQTLSFFIHGVEQGQMDLELNPGSNSIGEVDLFWQWQMDEPESYQVGLIYLNNGMIPLEVRKAMTLAIDKATFISQLNPMLSDPSVEWAPSNSFIPIGHPGYSAFDSLYDLERAKELIADHGKQGMEITILVNEENAVRIAWAEYVVEQWNEIGLVVDAEPVPFPDIVDLLANHEYQVALLGHTTIYLQSRSSIFRNFLFHSQVTQIAGMVSTVQEQLDRLIEASLLTIDGAQAYASLVQNIDELACEHYVSIPLGGILLK